MKYTIGVDIGTSGAKAVAIDESGMRLFVCSVPYSPISSADPNRHELDCNVLINAFADVVNRTVEALPESRPVAICLSTAMHGLICLDQNNEPLSNFITWADQRSIDVAAMMQSGGMSEIIHRNCGVPIHPMLPLCKIAWIRENDTSLFEHTRKFTGIKEYILWKFFGKICVDPSLAGAMGLFNIYSQNWDPVALQLAGIESGLLPELVGGNTSLSGLTLYGQSHLNVPRDIQMIIGSSDGCLANVGSGCYDNTTIALTIGTSGAARRIVHKEQYEYDKRTFAYCLEDMLVIGGPVNNGGILLKWYSEKFLDRKLSTAEDYEWFVGRAMSSVPGSNGLLFLPYIFGERAPVWDAKAKGAFIGIHNSHGSDDFMRAILEGIAFSLKKILLGLCNEKEGSTKIFASGGFTHSPEWVQLLADVVGMPIYVRDEGDASAIGAAIMGMKASGWIEDFGSIHSSDYKHIYQPSLGNKYLYDKLYQLHEGLYDQLASTFHGLHELTSR